MTVRPWTWYPAPQTTKHKISSVDLPLYFVECKTKSYELEYLVEKTSEQESIEVIIWLQGKVTQTCNLWLKENPIGEHPQPGIRVPFCEFFVSLIKR